MFLQNVNNSSTCEVLQRSILNLKKKNLEKKKDLPIYDFTKGGVGKAPTKEKGIS